MSIGTFDNNELASSVRAKLNATIDKANELDAAAVRADTAQTLSSAQQQTARTNIAAAASADVAGLQGQIDGKQPVGNYIVEGDARLTDARTPLPHTHAIADTVGLQAALDAASAASDLNAAARRIVSASDVVDVFIYDTLKDSDAGAWRYKVGHTSWMNEALGTATRGTRALFPSKALIVARGTGSATIYDLDDPDCLMWMVIGDGSGDGNDLFRDRAASLWALNGRIYAGLQGTFGAGYADFVLDSGWLWTQSAGPGPYRGNIAGRHGGLGFSLSFAAGNGAIVSNTVNDVAATVLPGTRPDPQRLGLPTPTVACATSGGLSVIHADGRVFNHVPAYTVSARVTWNGSRAIFQSGTAINNGAFYAADGYGGIKTVAMVNGFGANPFIIGHNFSSSNIEAIGDRKHAIGLSSSASLDFYSSKLAILHEDTSNAVNRLQCDIRSDVITGYMPGNIKLALAESTADVTSLVGGTVTDRSIAGNNATVVGTVTRAAVASGAELAAYSGFSASNYLEVPYDSDFDFGTGDFCVAFWGRTSNPGAGQYFIDRADTAGSGPIYRFFSDGGGWGFATTGASITNVGATPANIWQFIVGIRRNGVIYLYVDGVLRGTPASATADLSNATAVLRIGRLVASTPDASEGIIALPRITAFAPSPEAIAQIYEAERHLFQPNAKCLLPAANVQSLAYDDSRDELLVGTTAGTAVMKGLVRTELLNVAGVNDANLLSSDDHNVIAAADGIRVVGSAAEAYAALPAIPLREKATGGVILDAYDPNVVQYEGVTTDATPTVIGRLPIAEGKAFGFTATVSCSEYADPTDEGAYYVIEGRVHRGIGGNVTVNATTRTINEATGTMDAAASANTTLQTLDITLTGVASERIVHKIELRLVEIA